MNNLNYLCLCRLVLITHHLCSFYYGGKKKITEEGQKLNDKKYLIIQFSINCAIHYDDYVINVIRFLVMIRT